MSAKFWRFLPLRDRVYVPVLRSGQDIVTASMTGTQQKGHCVTLMILSVSVGTLGVFGCYVKDPVLPRPPCAETTWLDDMYGCICEQLTLEQCGG